MASEIRSREDDSPSLPGIAFHEFVSPRDFCQRDLFRNLETRPTCVQSSVQIAAQKVDPQILEHHRPERNVGPLTVCRIDGNRSVDVVVERHFDNVVDPVRRKCFEPCGEFRAIAEHFVSACFPGGDLRH